VFDGKQHRQQFKETQMTKSPEQIAREIVSHWYSIVPLEDVGRTPYKLIESFAEAIAAERDAARGLVEALICERGCEEALMVYGQAVYCSNCSAVMTYKKATGEGGE
jgi:hypothetical protein